MLKTHSDSSDTYINVNSNSSVKVLKFHGDPVVMATYIFGLSVLQDVIVYVKTRVKQVVCADDLSGAGKITDLKEWWNFVNDNGLTIGYTPNATRSVIIVARTL